jgi:glycolate oxidase iron-sulfur subunit
MKKPLKKQALDEASRCVRCGACMAVCPVYAVMRREHAVARGKIHLVQKALAEGEEGLKGRRLLDSLALCLKCGRCTSVCPNAVETAEVVRAAREAGYRRGSLKVAGAETVLSHRGLMRAAVGALGAFSGLVAEDLKGRPGLVLRLSAPGEGARRAVPRPPGKGFIKKAGGKDVVVEGKGKRYLLFTGCVGDVLRPQSSDAAVNLAKEAGVGLVVPAAQDCCGLMSYFTGDTETAMGLARRNVDLLSSYKADAIVTTCATCAVMLGVHYKGLVEGELPEVLTFSQFWERELKGRAGEKGAASQEKRVKLVFHEPCHLRHGMGVKSQPRTLLRSLKKADYLPTAGEDLCCGYGGVMNIENYDLSREIGTTKLGKIEAGGAEIVVTECAGCILQLTDILSASDKPFEIITTAEALERYR